MTQKILDKPVTFFETSHLEDIKPYVCKNTLVVFDIDNTLIEPISGVGSHQWGDFYFERLLAKGMGEREAEDLTIVAWKEVIPNLDYQLVESESPRLLEELKQMGALPIGLTARSPFEKDFTRKHLLSVGIDMTHEISPPETCFSHKSGNWVFSEGVIYKENLFPKGQALKEFFHEYELEHEKIIFIDDRIENVLSVLAALKNHEAAVLGVRYAGLDAKLERFDEKAILEEEKKLVATYPSLAAAF